MIKTLIQHGNSAALIIDKAILDILKISTDTPLEIETNGKQLIITPVRRTAKMRPEVKAAYDKIATKHRNVLKRLAE